MLRIIVLCVVAACTLAACGGGIYGTGDGSEIVVTTDNNSAGDVSSHLPDGILDTAISRLQYFPASGLGNVHSTEQSSMSEGVSMPTQPADPDLIATLKEGLNIHHQATTRLLFDLLLLEKQLAATLPDCESSALCTSIPTTVSGTVSDVGFNPTDARDDDQFSYSDISYRTDSGGYFDSSLSYTRDNGTTVELWWNNDKDLQYFFVASTDTFVHSLTDQQESTVSFRNLDTNTGALIQAVVAEQQNGTTLIEADSGDWYLRALTGNDTTVLYAKSSNDLTDRREATTATGTTVETCERSNCSWIPESTNQADSAMFDDTQNNVGDFSQTLSARPQISVPANARRFVVARATSGDTGGSPAQRSLVCGGVQIGEGARLFCWQPIPLTANPAYLFEETITGNLPGYLLIERE